INCIYKMRLTPLPLPYLYHFVMFVYSIQHNIGFLNRIGNWLFTIYIFACFKGVNQLQTMPMIWCAYYNSIYIFVFKEFSVIFIMLWFFYACFFQVSGSFSKDLIIYITKG